MADTEPVTGNYSNLPEAFKAFRDGWNEVTNSNVSYTVVLESEYSDDNVAEKLRATLLNMANLMIDALACRGKDPNNIVLIFEHLFGEATFAKLVDYTTQALVSKDKEPTNISEFQQFIASRIV